MAENEKQFESNIEAFLISRDGGYEKATDAGYTSSSGMALDIHTLVGFVKATSRLCGSVLKNSATLTHTRSFINVLKMPYRWMACCLSCDMDLNIVEWILRFAILSRNPL